MNDRLKELLSYMEIHNLNIILISHPKHIYYLTGFFTEPHERFLGLVLLRESDPFLLVPLLDLGKAMESSSIQSIYPVQDDQNPYEILEKLIPSGLSRMGLEEETTPVTRYRTLLQATGASETVDINGKLQEMRMIKTAKEVAAIKNSIRTMEEALRLCLKQIRIGMTEMDIVAELEYQMKKLGADEPSFATTVLFGEHAANPHGIPGKSRISEGELLLIDAGVFVDGYASDLTRTFAVGEIDGSLKKIYETVRLANLAAIQAVAPHVPFRNIDLAAWDLIQQQGFGRYFITRVGHGFGLEIHEYPSIHRGNIDLAKAGMVFTIEPGIYMPQKGGVRIEDNVLVTDNGAEVLTSFPKELTSVGIGG